MKKRWAVCLCLAFVAAISVWLLQPTGGQDPVGEGEGVLKSRMIREQKLQRRKAAEQRRRSARVAAAEARRARPKPVIEITEEENEALDDLQKKILKEITDALDREDFSFLQRAISHLRKVGMERARQAGSKDWMKFVSRSLRSAAITSLGWFEGEALPELAEFLADPDPDIMQEAMDQFELSMGDFTLGDYAKAEIIKSVCSVITDEDMCDWMMMEAINARNSVGADTLAYVALHGTDAAKSKVPEYMEFFTGEEISTIDQLQQWLNDNPDDPEVDEDLYGPISIDD